MTTISVELLMLPPKNVNNSKNKRKEQKVAALLFSLLGPSHTLSLVWSFVSGLPS